MARPGPSRQESLLLALLALSSVLGVIKAELLRYEAFSVPELENSTSRRIVQSFIRDTPCLLAAEDRHRRFPDRRLPAPPQAPRSP